MCFTVLNEVSRDGKGCAKGSQAQVCCWVKLLFLSDRTDFSLGCRRNLNGYRNIFVQSKQNNFKINASVSPHISSKGNGVGLDAVLRRPRLKSKDFWVVENHFCHLWQLLLFLQ